MKRQSRYAYYMFVFLLYFFLLRDWLERQVSLFGYIDELIAAFAIPIVISRICCRNWRTNLKRNSYKVAIFLFVIMSFAGSLIYKYQPFLKIALPDALLCIKFWLTIETGSYLFSKFDFLDYAKRLFAHIKVIVWFFVVLVLADNVFNIFETQIRSGIRSTQLFYYHTTVFGSCMIFLMCILLLINDKVGKKARLYFILLSLLVCSTMRTRLIASVVLFWLIWYLVYIRKKPFRFRTLAIFAPVVILIGWDKIQFYFNGAYKEQSARYMLLVKSFAVAKDHFPFGSGFATYGSYYSSVAYSPVYYKYGLNTVFGLMPDYGNYISDSFWPMIIAQAGIIGCACYIYAIYKLFVVVRPIQKISTSVYFCGLFILLYLLIESTAGSSFVHPVAMPLALLFGYIINISKG